MPIVKPMDARGVKRKKDNQGDFDAPVAEEPQAPAKAPRKDLYYALPAKLSSDRPRRERGTRIGMPGYAPMLGAKQARGSVKDRIPPAARPIVTSFFAHSQPGVYPDNPDKPNQDCWWTLPKFGGDDTLWYFGVADGHGANGQPAARFVASQLPQALHNQPEFPSDILGAFQCAFKTTDEELGKSVRVKFSGSTAVTCLIHGKKAYGAFIGDSRAIIARREENAWSIVPLSIDHKPDVPEERARIEATGGRVKPIECDGVPVGPARVWLQTKEGPGLAVSRSFGDTVAKRVGVSSEPAMLEVKLKPADKFFILASDGVWDFLSNAEVIDICAPFCSQGDSEGAVHALIKEASTRYMEEEGRTDDTTVVIGILDVRK
eukprot:GEMP01030308.1.p1 GENE.GEMP01030308.1~~GEMP01030308.1.p1  ORF type:complete len:376 (+),score=85.33 GEMP01030308.1:315-1442(+)